MKLVSDVTDRIHEIINVSTVTGLLDGEIYKDIPLEPSLYQMRNISIVPLPTSNDFINEHTVNINIYAPDLPTGQADEVTLTEIAEAVIEELLLYNSDDDYFEVKVISNTINKDDQNNSYLNIRIEVITE